MLSATTQRLTPDFTLSSRRILPTKTSSCPVAVIGIGYKLEEGSSITIMFGKFFNVEYKSSILKSFSNSTLIDSECELLTGTLTVVAVILKFGLCRIYGR